MTGSVLASLLAACAALLVPLLLGRQVVRALAGDALAAALGRAGEWGFAFGAGLTLVGVVLGLAYAAHVPAPGPATAVVALGAWVCSPGARAGAAASAHRAVRRATIGPLAPCNSRAGCCSRRCWPWWASHPGAAAGFPDAHLVWLLRQGAVPGQGGSYFRSWQTAHDNRATRRSSRSRRPGSTSSRNADARAAKMLSVAFLAALLAVAHGVLRRTWAAARSAHWRWPAARRYCWASEASPTCRWLPGAVRRCAAAGADEPLLLCWPFPWLAQC
jgi:hypothetical protein